VIDTRARLAKKFPTRAEAADTGLDDLLISWSEWSEGPAAVAGLGQVTTGLDERIATLEAELEALLPAEAQARFTELLVLHRQRAQEWGYSGVEFARRAIVTLLG
jgi:hypothetical protein